jgi:hypothetical protein
MLRCPRCGAFSPPNFTNCGNCGLLFVFPPGSAPAPGPVQFLPPRPRSMLNAVLGGLLLLLALVGIATILSNNQMPSGGTNSDGGGNKQNDAFFVCQEFVTERLKAPATADFAPRHESAISSSSGDGYEIESYVDSQNGYGAQIRTRYTCIVHPVAGTNQWKLFRLTTDP